MANRKRIINEAGTKTCSKCKADKHISEFRILKTGVFGVHAWCKECANANDIERYNAKKEYRRAKMKEWRDRDPEAYRAKRRAYWGERLEHRRATQNAWHSRNPAKKIFTNAKARAKKTGLEFTITMADITPLPDICPVLGIPLRKGNGSSDGNAYSLDRVDNSLGYIPGNVIVMSRRANVLKRDATAEEIHALSRWIASVNEDKLKLVS